MDAACSDTGEYAVILVRSDIDRFAHNALFSSELSRAFAIAGFTTQTIDYIKEPPRVRQALQDGKCRFFLSFNGFGAELQHVSWTGRLVSAFAAFNKPLFDLMHDCPAHESMAHQRSATFAERTLLATDFGYARIALELGIRDVLFVPSITFPGSVAAVTAPEARRFDVLLPLSLVPPALIEQRHAAATGYKQRLYRTLFHDVSAMAASDWRLDPLAELISACRAVGIALDWKDDDDRFLLTTTLDHVKFVRRHRLIKAVSHLPITVMSDREPDPALADTRISFIAPRSAQDLLSVMADSRCVLCPTPHLTGFHERVLGAFTAGAAVISSPNRVLEADFVHGRDLLFFQSEKEAADIIAMLLRDREHLADIATAGRIQAYSLFPPRRLVETILSLSSLRHPAASPFAVAASA